MVTLIVEQPSASVLSVDPVTPATMSADEAIMVSVNDYEELRNKPSIAGVELTGNKSLDDLGAYTKAQVDTKLSTKADKSQIPSLNGYATESWVENKHYLTEHQSLDGYATEQWVEDKHYLTQHQSLANYYTKGQTNDLLDGKADANAIPSKTSDLTNDSGFITSVPVESVNGKTGAVVLTASDVNALPSTTAIPSKTSDLTNDSGFITDAGVTSFNGSKGAVTYNAPVQSVNGKTGAVSLTASDVGALPSSTAIPTKTSDLTNDSNFITLADLPIYNGSVS